MSQFLDLPTELILDALLFLPPSSIVTCRLVNRRLNTLIRDSIVLQYALALDAAQTEDNPCSTLSKVSKLRALQSSEKAWSNLEADFIKPVPIEYHQSGVYDLSSGNLFISDASRTILYSMKLPAIKDDETEWNEIRVIKPVIDIGLCVFEHDLIAFVTSFPRSETAGTPPSFDIEVELREISTNSQHPQAKKSTLYVMNSPHDKPAVGIEIVGKHLILVLSFAEYDKLDHMFIFEWQNGSIKASWEAQPGSYSSLLFLSEDLFLLPHTRAGALDIFRIPSASTLESLVPILRLTLPALLQDHSFTHTSCRCEPNPISPASISEIKRRASARAAASAGDSFMGTKSPRAWLAKPEDSLCLFDVHIESNTDHFLLMNRLEFLVHRRALVAIVEDFERAKEDKKVCHATTTDQENQTPLTSNLALPSAPISASTSTSASLSPHPKLSVVPWKSWGNITSWTTTDEFTTDWITRSSGQRIVRMAELDFDDEDDDYGDEDPEKEPYIILDYNQVRVERTRKWLEAQPGHMQVRLGASRRFIGIGLLGNDGGVDGAAGGQEKTKATDEDDQAGTDGMPNLLVDDVNGGSDEENADEEHLIRGRHSQIDMECDPDDELQSDEDEAGGEDSLFSPYSDDRNLETPHPFPLNQSVFHSDRPLWEDVSDTSSMSEVSSQLQVDWRRPPPGAIYWAPAGEVFIDEGIFAEPIVSGLPYVGRVSRERYRYHGVMLDEERLIGTRSKLDSGRIERIDIHHFG